MGLTSKFNKAMRLSARLPGLARPSKALFVMSHMRSRSSMLSHVLGSHKRISGYYEMSRSYREPADLTRMKMAHLLENHDTPRADYYHDKILHNRFTVCEDILGSPKARFIFLAREPTASLSSMLKLGQRTDVPEC